MCAQNEMNYLVDIFGMPALFKAGEDYIPEKEFNGDTYEYIVVSSRDSMLLLDDGNEQRFVGYLLVKPEFYAIRPKEKMYDISVLGTVESFGSIISSRSNYIVIDRYNLASLRDKSNPMPTEEFLNNRIIRFRSQHHSTCTMSALTDELLYGLILVLKKLGKPVAKTFNHRRTDHSVTLSQDKFYVQFAIDDGCEYSHIHLPYQYWGRLDIPVIDCLDENADIQQPNSAVLLAKISEFIENYYNIV